MTTTAYRFAPRPMVLRRHTAGELMTRQPLSFDMGTPVQVASALLSHYQLEAAPVVDAAGRPVGAVTKSACTAWEEFSHRSFPEGESRFDGAPVSEIMSPDIGVVRADASTHDVIGALVRQRARRIYVVDDSGALAGVVSMADVLRHLLDGDAGYGVRRSSAARLC